MPSRARYIKLSLPWISCERMMRTVERGMKSWVKWKQGFRRVHTRRVIIPGDDVEYVITSMGCTV